MTNPILFNSVPICLPPADKNIPTQANIASVFVIGTFVIFNEKYARIGRYRGAINNITPTNLINRTQIH